MQNPANPCKLAGAGEAQKKEGKGCQPTYATRVAEGQAPGDRKGRKSTAQGGEPSDTPKTPPTQQQGSTIGVGQQTGARKVAEPAKVKLRQGKLRWHKVENQVVYQDTANLTTNVYCSSRPANRSQIGCGTRLRVTSCRTRRGKPQVPQKEAQKPHQKRPTRAYPTPSRRRERRHSSAASERNPTHTHRDHQRRGPAAKTHKASYRRIEISGE